MKITLAENIRNYRKEKKITQEQLAEAMGVTVGAVSRWESADTTPDIGIIISLAGFFETSVDVLLGYELKSNNLADSLAHMKALRNEKRFDIASVEAEKTLLRYPNSFDAVFRCGIMYALKAMETEDKKSARRALELFSRSLVLEGQNTDEHINAWTIRNNIANMYQLLGQHDDALAELKKNNADGLNDKSIGLLYAESEPDVALPYLSNALIHMISDLMVLNNGYVNSFFKKKMYADVIAFSTWTHDTLMGLKNGSEMSYLDRVSAQIMTVCAIAAYEMHDTDAARDYLVRAKVAAKQFDAAPTYGFEGVKFNYSTSGNTAFDNFGKTALSAVADTLEKQDDNAALVALWNEIVGN